MHVAVVGAGAAGLCAARHLTTSNSSFSCVVYEQTGTVGGTWVYTEATGVDEYGLPICSAMYKNLRTNLSKENMEFPDFPYINPKSFTSAAEVQKYLEDYSNHYNLKKYIKIYFSHKADIQRDAFPDNVEQMPVVKLVKEDHVIFEDDTTSDHIDVILICTGYNYSFPFLTPECGISVTEGKYVQPLYKHIINIHQPTMGFIGIPFRTFLFPLFDHQVCFFLKFLQGKIELPEKGNMLAELEEYTREKCERGIPLNLHHDLSKELESYVTHLGILANLKPLLPVHYNIYYATAVIRKSYLKNYRDIVFEVANDVEFNISGLKVDKEALMESTNCLRSKMHLQL